MLLEPATRAEAPAALVRRKKERRFVFMRASYRRE
jgi:hypothetical protein